MTLKTYDREYEADIDVNAPFHPGDVVTAPRVPAPWNFVVLGGCGDPDCEPLEPGKWVCHRGLGGRGMVIAVNEEQLSILWSEEPRDPFGTFAAPLVRRVFTPLIANQLVQVQPMTAPAAGIFYLDYTYKETWFDKRCNSGPRPVRMFWRGVLWIHTRTRSLWSSLSSWLASRSGKKSITTGSQKLKQLPASSLPDPKTVQSIVSEWTRRHGTR